MNSLQRGVAVAECIDCFVRQMAHSNEPYASELGQCRELEGGHISEECAIFERRVFSHVSYRSRQYALTRKVDVSQSGTRSSKRANRAICNLCNMAKMEIVQVPPKPTDLLNGTVR